MQPTGSTVKRQLMPTLSVHNVHAMLATERVYEYYKAYAAETGLYQPPSQKSNRHSSGKERQVEFPNFRPTGWYGRS